MGKLQWTISGLLTTAVLTLSYRLSVLPGPGCRGYWQQLSQFNLESFAEPSASLDPLAGTMLHFSDALPALTRWAAMGGESCTVESADKLAAHHRRTNRICRKALDRLAEPDSVECLLRLQEYRFFLTQRRFEGVPIGAIDQLSVAKALLFAEGLSPQPQPERMVSLAKRLVELAPTSQLARTYLLTVALQAFRMKRVARYETIVVKYLEKSADPPGGDPGELRFDYLRVSGQIMDLERSAERETKESEGFLGPYYLAWAKFLARDMKGAEEALWEALRRAPNLLSVYGTVVRFLERTPGTRDTEVFEGPELGFGTTVLHGRYGFGDTIQMEPSRRLVNPREYSNRDYPPELSELFPSGPLTQKEMKRLRAALVRIRTASLAP